MFDARKHGWLQQRDEFISFDLAIAENCREQPRADCLTRMDGYDGSTAVGMTKWWLPLIRATCNPAFLKAVMISRPVTLGRRVTPL